MTVQQIDGGRQIRSGTITTTQLASAAGIVDGQLATSYIKADGTRAFTGEVAGVTPTSTASLATKGYVDTVTQGLDPKPSARSMTDTETLTIAAGSVTTISGTTVGGVTVAVNDYVLIPNAPASTGAAGAATFTTQPANGLYKISAIGANITVARAPEQSGSIQPAGDFVFVEGGTVGGASVAGGGYVVTTPSAASGFTYGTNNIAWTQFSGAGEISVGSGLTKSGNTLDRAALTGDVTASAGSNATTIANNAVSYAKMADITTDTLIGRDTAGTGDPENISVGGGLEFSGSAGIQRSALTGDVTATAGSNSTTIAAAAVSLSKMANLTANSVIANTTGSSATPTATSLTAAATASTVPIRDGNANIRFNNAIENFQTIASAAGTTTLTVSSPRKTQITGSTTQTVKLPDATTLVVGQVFEVVNRSSGNVTVNDNASGLVQTMVSGSFLTATVTAVGTAAGTWDAAYTAAGGSGSVTTVSVVNANGFNGSVSTASTTPAITLTTTITGVLKGNGTAISAASNTAGADYVNASNFITRETPSGSVNGSNTTFTLANTPISGTEQVFLNGLLQEPGAGNDYTISTNTITYLSAPLSGDKIRVTYIK